ESPRHSVAQVEFVRALAEHTANRAGELELLRELTAVDEVDMANERVGTTPVSADREGSRQAQRHRESVAARLRNEVDLPAEEERRSDVLRITPAQVREILRHTSVLGVAGDERRV